MDRKSEKSAPSAEVVDLADMRRKLRPPPPGSLAAILQNIEAVRFDARTSSIYVGGG